MAVIRCAHPEQMPRGAVVLNLGDIRAEGERLRARARAEAERIIAEAHAERARIIATAADEGRERGRAEGFDQGRSEGQEQGRAEAQAHWQEKLAAVESGWSRALEEFDRDRDALVLSARQDVVELAAAVAERVVKHIVELDAGAAGAQLRAALELVTTPTGVRILVAEVDREAIEAAMPALVERFAGLTHAALEFDPAAERGSCVVRTAGGGEIDASVSTQSERIARLLTRRCSPDGDCE